MRDRLGEVPARIYTRNLQLAEDTVRVLRDIIDYIHHTPRAFEDWATPDSPGQNTDSMRVSSTSYLQRMNNDAHLALNYFESLALAHSRDYDLPNLDTARLPHRRPRR